MLRIFEDMELLRALAVSGTGRRLRQAGPAMLATLTISSPTNSPLEGVER